MCPSIMREVIINLRLPRLLACVLAGGALSMAGATLQGVFHNPLVDPHIIGVTAGAAFGGTLAILLGWAMPGLMLMAFLFGMMALVLVYGCASIMNSHSRLMIVLAGVILAGFFSALVSLVQYVSDSIEVLPRIVFWLMGSFSMISWPQVWAMVVVIGMGATVLYSLRWRLNLLTLGDREALGLGVNVKTLRWAVLGLCALMTSAQVAVCGSIGWIGLVVPHMARQLVGSDHRALLPMSFVLGATLMVIIDNVARTLTSAEIPIGIVTAIIGAPLFAIILFKNKRAVL